MESVANFSCSKMRYSDLREESWGKEAKWQTLYGQ